MANYELTLSDGNLARAGTRDNISIKLVGEDGESEREWLMGASSVTSGKGLVILCLPCLHGKLVLIELDKQSLHCS
ncbi:hypothetical protein FQN60_002447 [Etheostoma spectabile]|uniref:PLAT domain-containing protein n=1 Tax=Etheostoma spectabile TaxID=54343 RepID=A0A5J5C6L4_9PERO|nr:hypothetical protein FQN60_002447 [Etheostoma spectabile]